MKLSEIFNVVVDAQDVLDLFGDVDNVDQLRGRLRRLSQLEADDLLTCLEGLRTSVAALLDATLEVSPDLEDHADEVGEKDLGETPIDHELDELTGGSEEGENQSPGVPEPPEK